MVLICEDFDHGGVFRYPAYAAYMWLPFLWGIAAGEYSSFVALCLAIAQAEDDMDGPSLRKDVPRLLESRWQWTEGLSLSEFILKLIRSMDDPDANDRAEELILLVARYVWRDAQANYSPRRETREDGPFSPGRGLRVRRPEAERKQFNPRVSILRAVHYALDETRR